MRARLQNAVSSIVKHLFITANNKTRVYGDSGTRCSTSPRRPGSKPRRERHNDVYHADGATQASNVGTYPITCSGLTPASGVTYTAGTLAITQAPLTFTAVANTKTYDGTVSAAATPTTVGLKNHDSVTGLLETYADKNAGNGKTLAVSAYTINDHQ